MIGYKILSRLNLDVNIVATSKIGLDWICKKLTRLICSSTGKEINLGGQCKSLCVCIPVSRIESISIRIFDRNTWDYNFLHPWTTSCENIAYVRYLWHFVICCICVFVNLYLCICVFESPEYHFWCPWTLGFSKI